MSRSHLGWSAQALAPLFAVVLLASCEGGSPPSSPGGSTAEPARWGLSTSPLLEVGVVEGEDPYELDRVRSATRLSDGRIVVLNAGSRELRFFSSDGGFLFSAGKEGDGPGEFRYPLGLWRGAGDTLKVYDSGPDRFSFFDNGGVFLRSQGADLTGETPGPSGADPFGLDLWVHGWNWIDSPLPPSERGAIVAALSHMPLPDTALGARFVKVDGRGLLWVTAPVPPAEEPSLWQVYLPAGTLLATLEMPARFEPYEMGDDYVLGRFRDELDVEFVRLYGLTGAESAPHPGLEALTGQGPATYPELPEAGRDRIMLALRQVASFQEIYYSRNMTYVGDIGALQIPAERMPSGVRAQVMMADDRGWAGIFLDQESGASCALGFGANMPPGWSPPGTMLCPGR